MNKVRELSDIVSEIPNGAEIGLGGFIINRCGIAFAAELIRQHKKDLVLCSMMGTMDADLLVGAGAVKSYSYGGGSLDRFGRLDRVNEAIVKKTTEIKEYSGLALALRFLAGTLGVPFIPTKTLIGTDLLEELAKDKDCVQMGTSPFDGDQYLFVSKLQPEYSVIHAQMADEKGNIVIEGPVWDLETAKAGKKLIVTVEQLVSNEYIKRNPEKVTIPSVYTYAVALVPAGAYPGATHKVYDYDDKALRQYAKINQSQETFDAYLKEYVYGTKNHAEFIEKVGGAGVLNTIRADLAYGYVKGKVVLS
jgi:acyl CoA:acetate/3-ketoacid CoA transferase alpha subunit